MKSLKNECELLINTTHNCNLRCRYCFVEDGYNAFSGKEHSGEISYDTIQYLINFAFEYGKDFEKITFHFYGGEPLIAFNKIKILTEKIHTKFKNHITNVNFFITTNGTLITKEVASFFNQYKYKVLVSLDGQDFIHNSFRVLKNGEGTHHAILDNIRLLQRYRSIGLGLSAVIHRKNRLLPTYNYLKSFSPSFIKAEYIRTEINSVFELDNTSKKQYFEDLEIIAKEVISDLLNGKAPIDYRFNSRVLQLWRQTSRHEFCSAGSHILGIAANGDVFPCTLLIGSKNSIGNVKSGLDLDKVNNFKTWHNFSGKKICQDCEVNTLCGGGCAAMWSNLNRGFCEFIRHEIDLAKYIYNTVSRKKPEALALLVSKDFYLKLESLINFKNENF